LVTQSIPQKNPKKISQFIMKKKTETKALFKDNNIVIQKNDNLGTTNSIVVKEIREYGNENINKKNQ